MAYFVDDKVVRRNIGNHESTHGNFTYNLEEHGFFWIFQSSFGLTMFWDKGTRIYIRLSTRHAGQVHFHVHTSRC